MVCWFICILGNFPSPCLEGNKREGKRERERDLKGKEGNFEFRFLIKISTSWETIQT